MPRQYSLGKAQLTKGSSRIIASAEADWSGIPAASHFIRSGQPIGYQIAATTPPEASASGRWEIGLSGLYQSDSEAAASYVIHREFTAHGLPIWTVGDNETVALINRQNLILENLLGTAGQITNNTTGLPRKIILVGTPNQDEHIEFADA